MNEFANIGGKPREHRHSNKFAGYEWSRSRYHYRLWLSIEIVRRWAKGQLSLGGDNPRLDHRYCTFTANRLGPVSPRWIKRNKSKNNVTSVFTSSILQYNFSVFYYSTFSYFYIPFYIFQYNSFFKYFNLLFDGIFNHSKLKTLKDKRLNWILWSILY